MTDSIDLLEKRLRFALERIIPHQREVWRADINKRFRAWSDLPEYATHQGFNKLLAEFYVRAVQNSSMTCSFVDQRNAILDYLNASKIVIQDIEHVSDSQWLILSGRFPLLLTDMEKSISP
jgi:hypothetical protein